MTLCFDRNMIEAQRVQSVAGGEIMRFRHGIFKTVMEIYEVIIAIMSVGIVMRGIAPFITDKWFDPAVVVIDDALHYAIPLLGGHHGANEMALRLFNGGIVKQSIITTATNAIGATNVETIAQELNYSVMNRKSTNPINVKMLEEPVEVLRLAGPKIVIVDDNVAVLSKTSGTELILGIGTRKGVQKDAICEAIFSALYKIHASIDDVKVFATADIKLNEEGIFSAAEELGKPLALVPSNLINKMQVITKSRAEKVGLIGVAEPAALALSNLRELVLRKTTYGKVTIAVAR
ncbi:MAG TPA: cobalt-precorrin 5A hydrolase [Candidatus Acidoferrales bacterium]|nr:cobalt-precorrin 5A hydrolase [Candidatus Acidoferrales bacterium]